MKRNDFLKLAALISMTIDHVGAILFKDVLLLRLIGRIAFPIFAYHVSVGYINTTNLKKYSVRLLFFGVLSQPVYHIFFPGLNIFFTLFCSLIVINVYEKVHINAAILLMVAVMFINESLDYGVYGIALSLSFYVFRDSKVKCTATFVILSIFYLLYNDFFVGVLQSVSILSLLLIYKKWEINVTLPKYFFYCYYPIHLLLIYVIYVQM